MFAHGGCWYRHSKDNQGVHTFSVDADVVISGPFYSDVPPGVCQRGNPLLYLAEIQSAVFHVQVQECQTKVFG